jgi:hypothetical protein
MWLAAINPVGNPGRLNINNSVQSKHLPLNTKHKVKYHTKSAQMAQIMLISKRIHHLFQSQSVS